MERWNQLLSDQKFALLASRRFEQARPEIQAYLFETAEHLPQKTRVLLPEIHNLENFQVSQSMIDHLDEHYFRLDQAGIVDTAGFFFAAARFASAWMLFQQALTTADLMEAAYEAWHAKHSATDHQD